MTVSEHQQIIAELKAKISALEIGIKAIRHELEVGRPARFAKQRRAEIIAARRGLGIKEP